MMYRESLNRWRANLLHQSLAVIIIDIIVNTDI